jgi:fructokinase
MSYPGFSFGDSPSFFIFRNSKSKIYHMAVWGIDLGGTKIEGVVLSEEKEPKVLARTRIATEQEGGYEHILGRIAQLVNLLKTETGQSPEALGIGTPGSLDPRSRKLKGSNTVCLNGQPLRDDLAEKLGIPVQIANDANCFALAEARMGIVPEVAPEAHVVFGIIMGTGTGGGLVIDGKVLNGHHGISGEWGHNFLHESGGPCYCGRVGCVETLISGTGLQRFYESRSGHFKKLKDIYQEHKAGTNPIATETIQRLTHFFGYGLGWIVNILDPDVIVVGGGVGNIEEIYSDGVEELKEHVFNPGFNARVVKPKLGDSAGVFGAAFLV